MSIFDLFFPRRAKQSHLKNLIAVAYSDGDLDPNEARVLAEVAHRLDIADEEVRQIVKNHRKIRFSLPSSDTERISLLWDYICLIAADWFLEDREIGLVEWFCNRINLRSGVISSLIRRLREWNESGAPIRYMEQDFKKLLSDATVFKR